MSDDIRLSVKIIRTGRDMEGGVRLVTVTVR